MNIFNNFFTSGYEIKEDFKDIKSQYQMLNICLVLSSLGLLFGMANNSFHSETDLIYVEITLAIINIFMFFLLRIDQKYFEIIANIHTTQFTILFVYLIYTTQPEAMKHVWLFTYPIILLYYKNIKNAMLWLSVLFFMILIAPMQPFVEIDYSLKQIIYILIVVMIVALIIYFYKLKIDEAKLTILKQRKELLGFNEKLEKEVRLKTSELRDINESLEVTVQEKIEELIQKDKLLTVQSKQAVMGEMITMIAHQWRQPLSTITLQISNYQIEQLLYANGKKRAVDKTLEEISDTIMYLSETIDDFQTYFHPDKELNEIELHELLDKAINFTRPRLNESNIKINLKKRSDIVVTLYMNELIQVVLNLLNNAIDALLKVDKDELKIDIDVKEEDSLVKIDVSDNAGGISDDIIVRIFEPYYSTKGKNGTGLGLYMSQMIIFKQFNGNLSVKSSSAGTTFSIEFPKILEK